MVGSHVIGFSSTEVSALWSSYISDSLAVCISKYLLQITEDDEIKPLIEQSLSLSQSHIETIQHLFEKKNSLSPSDLLKQTLMLRLPLFSSILSH